MDGNAPRKTRWLRGCAIGCLVVLLVVCILGAVIYVLITGLVGTVGRMSKDTMAAEIALRFDQLNAAGKIVPEHKALFDDILNRSQDQQASTWAVLLVRVVLEQTLSDNSLSEDDLSLARSLDALLKTSGGVTQARYEQFLDDHPDLRTAVDTYLKNTLDFEEEETDALVDGTKSGTNEQVGAGGKPALNAARTPA